MNTTRPCKTCQKPFEAKHHCAEYCPSCAAERNKVRQREWKSKNREACNAHGEAFRKRMSGRVCDCGSPATVYFESAFICQKCMELEQYHRKHEDRRMTAGVRTLGIPEYRIHAAV